MALPPTRSSNADAPHRSVLWRRLRTATRLRSRDYRLLGEAMMALLRARRLSSLPFRELAPRLGGAVAAGTAPAPQPALTDRQRARVAGVRWAIRVVEPAMPFRTVCLQQAIAARTMLARDGIASVLHLGVGRDPAAALHAHAWLDAGDMKVTGYPLDPLLTEVARFT